MYRELLETGSTNFSMYENDEPDFGEKERVMTEEKAAVGILEDPFVKAYSTTKFYGIGGKHDKRLSDFDASYDDLDEIMESIIPDGGVKKLVSN